jgi:two-component system chemotaxis response regulator CheB
MAAVLLTGGNEDGSAGLQAVHRAGGVTIVQDPLDAQVPLMVEAALRRTPADFVLPLGGIARLISAAVPQ